MPRTASLAKNTWLGSHGPQQGTYYNLLIGHRIKLPSKFLPLYPDQRSSQTPAEESLCAVGCGQQRTHSWSQCREQVMWDTSETPTSHLDGYSWLSTRLFLK